MKLAFMGPNREIVSFLVEGRRVVYYDKLWKGGIQIYPLDQKLISKMKRGGLNIKMMAALILDANKGENLEQYNNCKTEEDIANMIKKDCVNKGLIEIK